VSESSDGHEAFPGPIAVSGTESTPVDSLAATVGSEGVYRPDTLAATARWRGWGASPVITLVEIAVAAALVGQLLVLSADVVARVMLHTYLDWTNDLAQISMMVMAFGGAVLASIRRRHMRIYALIDRAPPSVRQWLETTGALIVVVTAIAIAATAVPPLVSEWAQRSPVLQLSLIWTALPLPLGMAGIAAAAGWDLRARNLPVLLGGLGIVIAAIGVTWMAGQALGQQPAAVWPVAVECLAFALLIAVGVPIAISLVASTFAYLYLTGAAGPVAIPLAMQAQISDNFIFLAVPFFILTGAIMAEGGLSRHLGLWVTALLGGLRGGLHQVLVAMMFVFSGISGSKVADVAAVGAPMRAILERDGYEMGESAAVLAAAAAAGETIPPSIAMLILASITSLSVSALFLAGIVPAILISAALMLAVYVRSGAHQRAISQYGVRERLRLTVNAIPALLFPVILLGGIVSGIATPTEVSSVAAVLAVLTSILLYRELHWKQLWSVVVDVGTTTGALLLLIGCAAAFAWSLTIARVPYDIGAWLTSVGAGHTLVFLLLTVVVMVIMGSVLEGLPGILIFGPLLLPIAAQIGIPTLQFAIVFLVALGIGASLPPLGVVLYVATAVLKTRMEGAVKPTLAYLAVILLVLLGVLVFFPAVTTQLPSWAGLRG